MFFNWGKRAPFSPYILDAHQYQLRSSPAEFLETSICVELSSVIEDILQPYEFESYGLDNVYPLGLKGLKTASLTLKDILLGAFLGKSQTISKVKIGGDDNIFVNQKINDDGTIDLGDFKNINPIESVMFESIFSDSTVMLLRRCFSLLWNIYEQTERRDVLDQKMIFKMHGFHALFTEPKNEQELNTMEENKNLVLENYQNLLNGSGGVIDAQDEIGLLNGGSVNHGGFLIKIDMIYAEIARLLKIPLTRLLGRSPQGFNATGESDANNYTMTLERYRSNWLEPFLNIMKIDYKKTDSIDIDHLMHELDYLDKLVEMHNILDVDIPEEIKQKLIRLGSEIV